MGNSANDRDNTTITCSNCEACCCRLEVLLMAGDDIPPRFSGVNQWGGWVMSRLDDGWCAALDRATMRCTIYARRPAICRDYQAGDDDCLEQRAKLPGHAVVAVKKVV